MSRARKPAKFSAPKATFNSKLAREPNPGQTLAAGDSSRKQQRVPAQLTGSQRAGDEVQRATAGLIRVAHEKQHAGSLKKLLITVILALLAVGGVVLLGSLSQTIDWQSLFDLLR